MVYAVISPSMIIMPSRKHKDYTLGMDLSVVHTLATNKNIDSTINIKIDLVPIRTWTLLSI